jgi:hypothetical protein
MQGCRAGCGPGYEGSEYEYSFTMKSVLKDYTSIIAFGWMQGQAAAVMP